MKERRHASLRVLAYTIVLVHCAVRVTAQDDFDQSWPVEIQLTPSQSSRSIQRPVGIVAGLDTTIYIGTTAGQIYLADVKTGAGTLLNPGGDDQRFGGLCLDSRGPGTLYATGADSGIVYAFNRRGELLRKYRVEDPGKAFLAGCIQTRYQLIIVDAKNPQLYYLKIADEGPLRGSPPELDSTEYQGVLVPFDGQWEQTGNGINAYGVEWTAKYNETVYTMNSATGELFATVALKSKVSGVMRKVNVAGKMNLFPGALQLLFDSRNENIMYISMPHLNAIAVLEFSSESPRQAKFIRMLTSTLLDGPVAIGEYGEWIFPVSGRFSKESGTTAYSIVQVPRHQQILDEEDPDQEFTTVFDEASQSPLPIVADPNIIQQEVKQPPKSTGNNAPVAIASGSEPVVESPSSIPADDGGDEPPSDDENTEEDSVEEDSDDDEAEPDLEADGDDEESEPPSADDTFGEVEEDEEDGEDEADEEDDEEPDTSQVFSVNDQEPEEDETSGASCFPGSVTVQTQSRNLVKMSDLQIGDRVLASVDSHGRDIYSEVFMFSHQDPSAWSKFVSIVTVTGRTLQLSEGHYLYVNGTLAAAKTVRVGDMVSGAGGSTLLVSRVDMESAQGLYNPQTLAGDIVVSEIRTSTFTTAVKPSLASALLAPVRASHLLTPHWSSLLSAWMCRGGSGLERLMVRGRAVYY